MHYKPTDSHSYLLYSSSRPSHVKNSIPYSQLLRLRRLCSEDSDFSLKSEEMCHFFDKRGYPASVVQAGHHRAQQIDRQSALQTSQKENNIGEKVLIRYPPAKKLSSKRSILTAKILSRKLKTCKYKVQFKYPSSSSRTLTKWISVNQ